MTASPKRSRPTLPATDAEIDAWYQRMIAAGQHPGIVSYEMIAPDMTIKFHEQISIGGRDYDNDRDRDIWFWMRDHQPSVMVWLKARGLVYPVRLEPARDGGLNIATKPK